jgi:PHD/YefM family antitoxin component YafN of YafNO toxin-antitoxin module
VNKESSDQVILTSYEDYRGLEETAYLLRSPANRVQLEEALQHREFPDRSHLLVSGIHRNHVAGAISAG